MNTSFLYWIHLNLCISLLLALTVLLVGLETAHHYNVWYSCGIINVTIICSGCAQLLLVSFIISSSVCLLGCLLKGSHYS